MILDYSTKLAKAILIKESIIQKSTLDKTAEIVQVVVSLLIFLWRVSRHIFTFDSLLALLLTLSGLLSTYNIFLTSFYFPTQLRNDLISTNVKSKMNTYFIHPFKNISGLMSG